MVSDQEKGTMARIVNQHDELNQRDGKKIFLRSEIKGDVANLEGFQWPPQPKIRHGNYFIHLDQDFRAKSHEVLRKSKTRVKMVNTPNPGFLPNRARIPRIRNNMGRNYAHY